MKAAVRFLILASCAVLTLAGPISASAQPPPEVAAAVATFNYSKNMKPLGFSANPVPTDNTVAGSGVFNSDLAFWGDMAVQGTFGGFRLIDISDPENPEQIIDGTECASATSTTGNQGDIVIYGDIIVRSWNSPTPASGSQCGEDTMAAGEEGVHIIDISDPTNPEVIGFVDLLCGSHTLTAVPDPENNRLLIYSNSSSGTFLGGGPVETSSCRGFDIVEVPLDDPADASFLRFEPAGDESMPAEMHHPCHDTSVFLADVQLVACAGSGAAAGGEGAGIAVFTTDPALGGSLENPEFLYYTVTGGSGIGHSASFTWDGKYIIVGHEQGGGSGAECDPLDPPIERTFFFVNAETGNVDGQFTLPRLQTNLENCVTHNFNVVPTDKGYIMVSGNYQYGISVINFTDILNAEPGPYPPGMAPQVGCEIAFADPAPLVDPNPPVGIELGGDWSSYWYNGHIYESDILRGLIVWKLTDPAVAGAKKLDHLNPQTQLESFDLHKKAGSFKQLQCP